MGNPLGVKGLKISRSTEMFPKVASNNNFLLWYSCECKVNAGCKIIVSLVVV